MWRVFGRFIWTEGPWKVTFRPFSCSKCDEVFAKSEKLKTHERVLSFERLVGCSQCDKFFVDSYELKAHKKGTFRRQTIQLRPMWQSFFTNSEELKSHETEHSSKQPFSCSQCDEVFAKSEKLKTHERVYSSKKLVGCFQCDEFLVDSYQHQFVKTRFCRVLSKMS